MRRALIQGYRSARRSAVRKALISRPFFTSPVNRLLAGSRSATSTDRSDAPTQVLHSSMYFRSFSVAAFVSMLASGVWYYQRDPETRALVNGTNVKTSGAGFSSSQYSTLASTSGFSSPQTQSASSSVVPQAETASKRRALVVKDDEFYVEELSEETPLTKQADNDGLSRSEMLTPEQATQQLRKTEESFLVGRGRGVVRYDTVQIPSNNPIEDDHAEKIVEVPQTVTRTSEGTPSSDWMFWGVFDGHSGWTTSAKLRQVLISYVARELNSTYKAAMTDPSLTLPNPQSIDAAIKRGFLALDHEIVHASVEKALKNQKQKAAAAELLAPALSGSCALLSFYDSATKLFRVAVTGDSRAVLGRKSQTTGKWTATPLSEDQTGGTPSEAARLRAEHPGEDSVVFRGRILGGLEPSRAFGDASYKWTKEVQLRIKDLFYGRSPPPILKTPPYVTAEPIITTTKVEPESGDFVVLATDGLWEMLTNEEVVGLVGQWLEDQRKTQSTADWAKSFFSRGNKTLPVEKPGLKGDASEEGQRAPIRQQQWQIQSNDERFVVEDKNAATHLVRNALGGRNRDMVCGLLTLVSPFSRRYRDDLTVEVIFFGEGDKSGDVILNTEASAPALGVKPKL
ncbi:[Pyruvate dehydrogenase [acetyl-transferring]]-phosphatase 1, mitochondrial [Lecanora helva]